VHSHMHHSSSLLSSAIVQAWIISALRSHGPLTRAALHQHVRQVGIGRLSQELNRLRRQRLVYRDTISPPRWFTRPD
jgi:DNA-binding HxlR family transcriptional regulator